MPHPTNRWVTLLAATALLATAAPAASAAGPAGLSWGGCADRPDDAGVECATLPVPLDWSDPSGPSIGLALARTRAARPTERIGSLLVNPGGPGGSGVDMVFRRRFSSALSDRFDVVGFDPRGTNRSHPVRCDATGFSEALRFPTNATEFERNLAQNRRIGASCRQLTGPLAHHVDTASSARDIEAIRVALGEQRVSYYGVSYGTQLGAQYAELFGHRLRAMVLDSNVDHSIDEWTFQRSQAVVVEANLGQFADWCARTTGCPLGDQARQVYSRVLARATRGQLPGWSADQVRWLFYNNMYNPARSWNPLAAKLRELDQAQRPAPPATTRRGPRDAADFDAQYRSVTCQDWRFTINDHQRLAGWERRLRQDAPVLGSSALAWTDMTGCLGWPAPVTNPPHRLRVQAPVPVLLVNSRYDIISPLSWAERMRRQLPGSSLLAYDGVGHGDYWLSQCAQQRVDAYLLQPRAVEPGARCPAVWPAGPRARRQGQELAPPVATGRDVASVWG